MELLITAYSGSRERLCSLKQMAAMGTYAQITNLKGTTPPLLALPRRRQHLLFIRRDRRGVFILESLSDASLWLCMGSIHGLSFLVVAVMLFQGDKVPAFLAFVAKEGAFILIHIEMTFWIPAKGASFQDRLS